MGVSNSSGVSSFNSNFSSAGGDSFRWETPGAPQAAKDHQEEHVAQELSKMSLFLTFQSADMEEAYWVGYYGG